MVRSVANVSSIEIFFRIKENALAQKLCWNNFDGYTSRGDYEIKNDNE